MQRSPRFFRAVSLTLLGGCLLGASLLSPVPVILAQEAPVPQEEITLSVGDVFEILAVDTTADAQFAWVLSMDRTFIQASRDALFQVRIVDPGLYRLDASAQTPDGSLFEQRTFLLNVRSRPVAEDGTPIALPQPSPPFPGALAATDPALDGNTLLLSPDRQVVRLTPVREDATQIRLNTDVTREIMGNGSIDDVAGSFFASARSPLFVWLSSPRTERTMLLTGTLADGSVAEQTVRVIQGNQGNSSPSGPPLVDGGSFAVMPQEDGSVRFSFAPPPETAGTPLLTHWSFGDGSESLQTEPAHRYARSGTYDVQATVTDLRTGETVASMRSDVTVEVFVPIANASSAAAALSSRSSAAASSAAGTAEPAGGGISFRFVLILLLILVASIVAGAGVVWGISKVMSGAGGLQKKLEEAESRIMKQKNGEASPLDVTPLHIPRTEPTAPEAAEQTEPAAVEETPAVPAATPEKPETAPAAEPAIDIDQAPAWLKQGLETNTEPTPTLEPPPPPAPSSTPKEAPPSPPPSATPAQDDRPAWLQESSPPEEQKKPSPQAETPSWLFPPAEQPKPEPPPPPSTSTETTAPMRVAEPPATPAVTPQQPAPAAPPAEEPKVDMDQAPAWLRQGMQTTAKKEPAPPSPPPAVPSEAPKQETPPTPAMESKAEQPAPPPKETNESNESKETKEPRIEGQPMKETPPPTTVPSQMPTLATPPQSKEELEREERERERKRQKRKRYRENLKKRNQTAAASPEQSRGVPGREPQNDRTSQATTGGREASKQETNSTSPSGLRGAGETADILKKVEPKKETPKQVVSAPVKKEEPKAAPKQEELKAPPAHLSADTPQPHPPAPPKLPRNEGGSAGAIPAKAPAPEKKPEAQPGDSDVVFMVEAENLKKKTEGDQSKK